MSRRPDFDEQMSGFWWADVQILISKCPDPDEQMSQKVMSRCPMSKCYTTGRGRGTFTTQPHCISFDIPHTWHLWDTLHFIGKVVPLYLIRFQRGTWHWISNQYYKIVILRQCEQNYEGRLSSILQMRTDIWQKLHWYMQCIATLETESLGYNGKDLLRHLR